MSWNSPLPWQRNTTFAEGNSDLVDNTNKLPAGITGREYVVEDTVHGTGYPVTLKAVRNHSTTALTINNRLVVYKTGAGDYGHNIGKANADGLQSFPIDDALVEAKNGKTIIPGDIFYIVIHGPCDVDFSSSGTATDFALHAEGALGSSDENGMIKQTAAAATEYIVGAHVETPVTAGYPYLMIIGEPRTFV